MKDLNTETETGDYEKDGFSAYSDDGFATDALTRVILKEKEAEQKLEVTSQQVSLPVIMLVKYFSRRTF